MTPSTHLNSPKIGVNYIQSVYHGHLQSTQRVHSEQEPKPFYLTLWPNVSFTFLFLHKRHQGYFWFEHCNPIAENLLTWELETIPAYRTFLALCPWGTHTELLLHHDSWKSFLWIYCNGKHDSVRDHKQTGQHKIVHVYSLRILLMCFMFY